MWTFILVSCLATLASARPEPPVQSGYQYNRPSGGGNIGFGGGFGGGLGAGSSNIGIGSFGNGQQQQYQSPNLIGSNSGGFGITAPGPVQQVQQFAPVAPQQAIVQKHIYVHVPPPEQEEVFQRQSYPVPPAQKHYKIIFIKTPSPPSYSQQQLQLAAQNEEKTLVYVLVKKPDAPEDIVLPQPIATQPSKPEVYFIKYKTQKQPGGAALVGGSSNLGASIANLPIQQNLGPNLGSFGSASSSGGISAQAPAAQYGPPGQSGPY